MRLDAHTSRGKTQSLSNMDCVIRYICDALGPQDETIKIEIGALTAEAANDRTLAKGTEKHNKLRESISRV